MRLSHRPSSAGWGGQARVVFREALESGEYRAVFAEMSVQNYDPARTPARRSAKKEVKEEEKEETR
jgi:hypothetical protein